MKTLYDIKNVSLLKKGGSLMFCENCGKIVGSINEKAYSYVYFTFLCSCNTELRHHVEINKHEYTPKPVNYAPNINNLGVYTCKKCNIPLFSVAEERIRGFSFHIKCICGEIYDKRPTSQKRRRLGETLMKFKKMSAN